MRLSAVGLIVTCGIGLLLTPLVVAAQQPGKVYRIGFLASTDEHIAKNLLTALQQALQALGYVEGKNLVVESRYAAGEFARLPDLATEFVRLPVDVIVTEGAPAAQAAQRSTTTIPIVLANAADPVGQGFVASLAQPGGNITGLSMMSPDL